MAVPYRRRKTKFLLVIGLVSVLALNVSVIRYAVPSRTNSNELLFLRHFYEVRSSPLGPETGASSTIEFGSCLLLMDDSHRLAEWISYHYFVLPLSYLVVAIDPYSRSDITQKTLDILDQWKPYLKNITVWTSDDAYGFNETVDRFTQHSKRQKYFYRSCTLHMKKIARTTPSVWITYHDIDEFISLNSLLVRNAPSMMSFPAAIRRYLLANTRSVSNNSSLGPTPSDQVESINNGHPCIGIPRILYSAVESFDYEIQGNVGLDLIARSSIDLRRLETMRWRYRTRDNDTENNLKGKAMVDIVKLPSEMIPPTMLWMHRPITSLCPHPKQYRVGLSPIILHHYLGSWEWYSYRCDDPRRGQTKNALIWKYRSTLQGGGANDEARGWLKGFVRMMGPGVAGALLGSAGILLNSTCSISKVNASNKDEWEMQDPQWLASLAETTPGYYKFLLEQSHESVSRSGSSHISL
jgi:hypothetical protein